ncbi:MAG: helix-turn-helix domain-containing protein [Chloroflexota bacterium]|nr:helix-turn-helix domain-containing protein [Chloroflexota bacterium]
MLQRMSNKTYNQYCAIAEALDRVGERWTLLIIRNLLAGPKRFSDLLKGLPGISTNILTDRLKALEEDAVIITRYLPPPAASTVYELTPSGYGLVGALSALAQWGAQSLGTPQAGQTVVAESVIFMILGVFWRQSAFPEPVTCNFHVQDACYDHVFGVMLDTGARIKDQPLDDAEVRLVSDLETLLRLSSKQLRLADTVEAGRVRLEGEPQPRALLIQWADS